MKDYVIINGVSSKTKTGLAINILPPITKPEMRTLVEEIDGRDGDIITKLGYSAYDKTIEIGLFGNGYDVDDIIAFFNKEGTITFSNEPTKYYNFTLVDSFDIERLLQFKTSTITFHCQPFKYEAGETPKEIEYDYVSGEGTEITLNNTMNALMELELDPSELTQETTTGKNKLPNTITSQTKNDLIITVNSDKSVTINGTASADTNIGIPSDNFNLPAGTYTLSGTPSTGSSSTYKIQLTGIDSAKNDNGSGVTFTTTTDYSGVYVIIKVYNGTQLNNATFYPMLELGSQITSYEPYTGGIPQPNPGYPSEVQVIKGNNSIKITNKNLINFINIEYTTANYGTATRTTEGYTVTTGSSQYGFCGFAQSQLNLKPNTTYTFSTKIKSTTNSNGSRVRANQSITSTGVQIWGNYASAGSVSSVTFTTPNTIPDNAYVALYPSTTDATATFVEIQIEKGSTATSYMAHQEQVLPLNLPVENLIPTNTDAWEQGTISSSNGLNSASTARVRTIDYYNIVPGNYSISIQNSTYCWLNMLYYDSNKNYITSQSSIASIDGLQTAQITVPNGIKYFRATIKIDNSTTILPSDINLAKPQVEKGTKANQYTPFGTTPIEYCKIGDYADEFEHDLDIDKWYINKAIGKAIFTGSVDESWNYETVSGRHNFYINVPDARGGNTNRIYNSIGIYNTNIMDSNYNTYISSGTTYKWLNYRCDEYSTVSDFKTMLSSTNMVVYYQLASPTHTEITDSTLIGQLNAIEQAASYDGQTNISQTNTQLPFRIKATAMISGSDSVEITNNGNVYAKPILDIKGTGIINVYLNGTQMFSVDITDEIIVDIPNLETYNPNTSALMNRSVTGNISNFIIPVGTNTITVDGAVEKVTITMYQRWL